MPDLEGMRKKLTQDRYKDYSNSKGKTALGATPASNPAAMEIKIPAQRKRLSLTQQRAATKGSTQARSDEQMVLFSGECSFKFKFRLIGIERLNVLFEELSEFVATENKDTKPRNVQLDNKEAVYHLPDDDGRLAKMAAWVKKKVGMRQTEGNDEGAAKGQLSKYLNRSIEVHESLPQPARYEDEKRNMAEGGLFAGLPLGSVGLW